MSNDPNAVKAWDWNAPGKMVQGLVKTGLIPSQKFNQIELLRLQKLILSRNLFIENGIQRVIEKHAKQLRNNIQTDAPYDYEELDNYHMREHMTDKPIKDGRAVESEAGYSGLLEYGTARHGVQYVFFRPATERTWKAYKEEVFKIMKGIFSI